MPAAGEQPTVRCRVRGIRALGVRRDAVLTVEAVLAADASWAPAGHVVAWGQAVARPRGRRHPRRRRPPLGTRLGAASPPRGPCASGRAGLRRDDRAAAAARCTGARRPVARSASCSDRERPRPGRPERHRRGVARRRGLTGCGTASTRVEAGTAGCASRGVRRLVAPARRRVGRCPGAPTATAWCSRRRGLRRPVARHPVHASRHLGSAPRSAVLPARAARTRSRWWGRGPGETYVDSFEGSRVGGFSRTIDELQVPYPVPQENGNHVQTRWLELAGPACPRCAWRVAPSSTSRPGAGRRSTWSAPQAARTRRYRARVAQRRSPPAGAGLGIRRSRAARAISRAARADDVVRAALCGVTGGLRRRAAGHRRRGSRAHLPALEQQLEPVHGARRGEWARSSTTLPHGFAAIDSESMPSSRVTRLEVSPPHTMTRRAAPAARRRVDDGCRRSGDRLERRAARPPRRVSASSEVKATLRPESRAASTVVQRRPARGRFASSGSGRTSQPASAAASACRRVWRERLPDTASTGPAPGVDAGAAGASPRVRRGEPVAEPARSRSRTPGRAVRQIAAPTATGARR